MSYIVNGYEDNGHRGETTRVVVPCLATGLPSINGITSAAFGHEYPVPYTVFGSFPDTGPDGINTATSVVVVAGTPGSLPTSGWAPVSRVPEYKLWSDQAQGRDFEIWGKNCGAFADYSSSQVDTYTTGWTTGKPRLVVKPALAEIGVSGFAVVTLDDLVAFCDDPTATITVTVGAVEKYSAVYGGNQTTPFTLGECADLGMVTVEIDATNAIGSVTLNTLVIIMDNNGYCGEP